MLVFRFIEALAERNLLVVGYRNGKVKVVEFFQNENKAPQLYCEMEGNSGKFETNKVVILEFINSCKQITCLSTS